MTLILSLMTAFKYGRSWVLANVIVSSRDGNVEWISDINSFSLSRLLRSRSIVNVAVRLVVSLPAILLKFEHWMMSRTVLPT